MQFVQDLRRQLEVAETSTAGTSFGGNGPKGNFSVTALRDWVSANIPYDDSGLANIYQRLNAICDTKTMNSLLSSSIRSSFLIELTDIRVGSTKMKTRWLPGLILMPQPGSFAPIQGSFEPGNDPRSASFETCLLVFRRFLSLCDQNLGNNADNLMALKRFIANTRVPYEFPISYIDATLDPIHEPDNVDWVLNPDARWLASARFILKKVAGNDGRAIKKICDSKLKVKVFLTDRALTGKDKTNRAKRWEVLSGDFQQATLPECWSVERKLTEQLVEFAGFPPAIRRRFADEGLLPVAAERSKCPVTLANLEFGPFADAVLSAQHGRSDYQIGHMTPLKNGGRHAGINVSWQSADGNRIQGDLTLQATRTLITEIAQRQNEAGL